MREAAETDPTVWEEEEQAEKKSTEAPMGMTGRGGCSEQARWETDNLLSLQRACSRERGHREVERALTSAMVAEGLL